MEIYREDDIAGDQKSQKHPVYIYSDRDADGALASGRDDSCNHLLYDLSDKTIYFSSYDVDVYKRQIMDSPRRSLMKLISLL